MATKNINGSYPAGYYLKPAYETLDIGLAGSVGGAGVTTTATQPSTINNLGAVQGSANGITLSGGGAITNGSGTDSTALIGGIHPIVAYKAAATVTNYGKINSSLYAYYHPGHGVYQQYGFYAGVSLNAGGTVSNKVGAEINHGIKISGGTGSVVNDGTIGNPVTYYYYVFSMLDTGFSPEPSGPSVALSQGGNVTNGSLTNTSALLENGIAISGGTGTIVNYGTIGPGGVALEAGGSITNGTASDKTAEISGVGITGNGTVTNFGSITVVGIGGTGTVTNYGSLGGVGLGAGTVTNGSATDTGASISAAHNGITFQNQAGTVTNFGSITSTTSAGSQSFAGVSFAAGGTLTNGNASDHAAHISGIIGVQLVGAGTVTNFGTIKGTGGTAVSFGSSSDTLVEEGTGVLTDKVAGGGGTLELGANAGAGALAGLGGTIAGFATIVVDKGAVWSLSGASTVAKNVALSNSGALTLLGQVTNSGQINNLAGATLAFGGDYSITTDPTIKAGQFTNAGLVQKTSGTGTSIIRTGTASLTDTGTIEVDSGILELTGSSVSIAGKITGAGTIEFSTGATTLNTGTTITAAGLMLAGSGAELTVAHNLGYSGTFSAGANTELTIASGALLQVSGSASFFHDTVDGAGRLTTSGTSAVNLVTLGGTAQWFNTGTITETGTLTIGDSAGDKAVFNNQAAGVFDLASNAGIAIGTSTASTFSNQGLVEKTVGGLSTIGIAMTNTGTIEAASGTLDLQQAVTGTGGTLKIDAGKVIQADAAVSGGQTVDFNGGGDRLILTDAAHFAGKLQDFGVGNKLDLRQFAPAATTLGFVENAGNSGGTLTVTDGALVAKIALLGQYSASAFHTSSDGVGGTYITYTPPPEPALIAAPHS